jgi:hypothetical protein
LKIPEFNYETHENHEKFNHKQNNFSFFVCARVFRSQIKVFTPASSELRAIEKQKIRRHSFEV